MLYSRISWSRIFWSRMPWLKMLWSRRFWHICMAFALAGWFFIIAGFLSNFSGFMHHLWVVVTIVWCIGHPLEVMISAPIAKQAGYAEEKIFQNTLAFGLTWWIPVKLGVFTP